MCGSVTTQQCHESPCVLSAEVWRAQGGVAGYSARRNLVLMMQEEEACTTPCLLDQQLNLGKNPIGTIDMQYSRCQRTS